MMNIKSIFFLLWVVLAAVSLTGCVQGQAFSSPADAALQAIRDLQMPGFTTNAGSIRVLHQQQQGTITLVSVSFAGTRVGSGTEICLFDVETVRAGLIRWQSRNSDGTCVPNPPAADQPPILIKNSHGGADQGGPGYSSFSGLTLQEGIDSVQVTWSDGKLEKVSGTQGLFFTSRPGAFDLKKVEALDTEMKTIYAHDFR